MEADGIKAIRDRARAELAKRRASNKTEEFVDAVLTEAIEQTLAVIDSRMEVAAAHAVARIQTSEVGLSPAAMMKIITKALKALTA